MSSAGVARARCLCGGRAVRIAAARASSQRSSTALQAPQDAPKSSPSSDVTKRDSEIPDGLPSDFSRPISDEFEASSGTGTLDLADTTLADPEETKRGLSFGGSLKGMVLLNVGAALFGSNMVVIKTAEAGLSPTMLNALRFTLAAACFAPLLPRALKERSMLRPALELGAWLTAGYTAQSVGLAMTSASHGAFTGTFTVLAVPMLVGLSGRKIAGRTWAAAFAALIGVSLLTTSNAEPNLGDLVCIASATLFGVHKYRSESVTGRVSDTTGLVALQLAILAAGACLLAAPEAVDALAGPAATGGAPAVLDATCAAAADVPWAQVAFMGIGTTALTLWIEMDALKEVSAPLAALIYSAEPLWGAAGAWVLLGDRWGAQGWVGAALIIGSSILSQIGGDVAERAKAEVGTKEA